MAAFPPRAALCRWFAALALCASVVGCAPPPPDPGPCGAGNCTGCCDASGACAPGISASACGVGGLACQVCTEERTCEGGRCSGWWGPDSGTSTPARDSGRPDESADAGEPCAGDLSRCGSACVDLHRDDRHCGACDHACSEGAACTEARCGLLPTDCRLTPCPATHYCDLLDGRCLPGCAFDAQCAQPGACDLSTHACRCAGGHRSCAGGCILESAQSCGEACLVCPVPENATPSCVAGRCEFSCQAGAHRCGDACRSNTSVESCGAACAPCPPDPNGTVRCSASQCIADCRSGYAWCGGACSACPSQGVARTECSGATCVAAQCEPGFALCDAFCASCPSAGVKQTRCNANRCVAASCVTGYSLCDESCAQCPTVGVGQTRCSGRQCVAAACASGFYPCGDGCCPWRLQTVFRGSGDSLGLALALDDAGLPRVAFVEESTHQLRYAEAEALPDGGLQWTVSLPSRPDAGVDLDPSLVLDRGGPVVAFHEQSTRTLFVARRAGGTWAATAVEIGGRWPALVAATSGGLRLAYGLSTSSGSALRYASEGPGGWSLSTVEPTGAEGVSAVLDGNGTPHLGYLAGGAELRYATASPALPSGWSVQRIDTGSSTCHTASVLGRSGSPRLLLPCTNAAVKLATQQTTGWRLETLVASTPFRRAGLAVDRRDRTWVVYGEGGKLVLAVEDPGMSPGWAKSAIATASVGSARLALSGSDRPIVLFWEQSLHELRVMW